MLGCALVLQDLDDRVLGFEVGAFHPLAGFECDAQDVALAEGFLACLDRAHKIRVLDRHKNRAAAVRHAPLVAFLKGRRDDRDARLGGGDRLAFVLGGGEEVLRLVLRDVQRLLALVRKMGPGSHFRRSIRWQVSLP